jgi:hypothetical protein
MHQADKLQAYVLENKYELTTTTKSLVLKKLGTQELYEWIKLKIAHTIAKGSENATIRAKQGRTGIS